MSIAAQVLYRDQYIAAFERRESVLRGAVTTDTESRGSAVYFLVAGSGGRQAVTRGSNGLIPPSDDSQVQIPITFAEAHDLNEKTNFDIFKAQGNQLQLMRENGIAVINRKIDATIIAAAETGTVSLGNVGAMSKTVANRIATILRNANAGEADSGNLYTLVTPACWAYLTDITSFANSQYSRTGGKVDEGLPQLGRWVYWMGINWGEHTGLTGNGTASGVCLAWHKAALGHAIASGTIDAAIGRDEKQDTSWARHSVYQGASKLQNAGIVKFTHDDTGLSS
jgi:hypothetical protein